MSFFKRLFSVLFLAQGKNGLFFQRLFWGALLGYLSTVLLADSSYLNGLESSMIEWRYQLAEKIDPIGRKANIYSRISLIDFDDNAQFELGIVRFNDNHSQQILAQAIENVEKCSPDMVVLDLDLRGATCPALSKLFQRYNNIVLALFGNLDGSVDLPSPSYLSHFAHFGYDELPGDSSGSVRQLPISYQARAANLSSADGNTLLSVPSLSEAVFDLDLALHNFGPTLEQLINKTAIPWYVSSRKMNYLTNSFLDVFRGDIKTEAFQKKIVIIGSALTPRHPEITRDKIISYPRLKMHADAISTLLQKQQISLCSNLIGQVLTMIIGVMFCSLASILSLGRRSIAFITIAICLLVAAQVLFQMNHRIVPLASPLAVLTLCFTLGTFIHLDTDLRVRNRELARARESMQIRAEAERQRIAEDLHDETLPTLSAVARMADQLNKELGNNPIPSQMRERLDFTANEMRRVINDLHPSVLETMGFIPALDNLLATATRNSDIETQFISNDSVQDEYISKFCQLQLYRIVQECLNNVDKHAKASQVSISIARKGNRLLLSIADNGEGMPIGILKKESHGILNIKQRAQLIAADVEWKQPSRYPSGTEVTIDMDLNYHKEIK
jgi:signal transduction histidine kinase